jgi:hypothetical protein
MVATCSTTRDKRRYVLGQLGGGIAGGLVLGSVSATVVLTVPTAAAQTLGVGMGIGGVVATIAGFNPRRLLLSAKKQVPERWCRMLPPGSLGFGFGLLLGTGVATPTPIMAPQILLAATLVADDVRVCVVAGCLYGFTRAAIPIGVVVLGITSPRARAAVDKTFAAVRVFTAVVGIAVMVLVASAT